MLSSCPDGSVHKAAGLQCNVFGGTAACMSVPQHSRVADLCKDEVASQSKVTSALFC